MTQPDNRSKPAGNGSAIFVVGASRSGTALVRSILNNHPDVHVAGETHYFDDLRPRIGVPEAPLTDEAREACENYFLALSHRPYGHGGDPAQARLGRDELRTAARQFGDGSDAIFEAYCRLEEGAWGRSRWGEKTPRHVYRLNDLLTRYPDAQVVCMVRDPRATVASYRDWRNQGGFDLEADPGHAATLEQEEARARNSYHVVLATLLWRSTVAAPLEARARFGAKRVWLQHYEELVREPEAVIRRLTDWLGLEFRPALLDVPMHNSSVAGFARGKGVSTDPLDRWQTRLSAGEISVIEWWAGRAMREAGYAPLHPRPKLVAFLAAALSLPFAVVRALLANRARVPNLPQYVWRRLRLALGGARGA